jgi:hypothetical protein
VRLSRSSGRTSATVMARVSLAGSMTRALLRKGQELIDDEAARGSQSGLDAPLERGITPPRDANRAHPT